MDLDVRGLLVFCHSELWRMKYDEIPAMVRTLVSDKTLLDLAERNKGWFGEVAARYEGMAYPPFNDVRCR